MIGIHNVHLRPWTGVVLVVGLLAMISGIMSAQTPIVLGQPGAMPGVLTLKPPDASGWYHLDNPGNQQLRFSGGGAPGQFVYMTISHPGKVTIHGDLEVTGTLRGGSKLGRGRGVVAPPPLQPLPPARRSADGADDEKADGGNSNRDLQKQVDQLTLAVNQLVSRVNALSR